MSGDDGTDPNTKVPADRCMWVPAAISCHARHSTPLSPKDLALVALPDTGKPPGVAPRNPGSF
jgi:hypothetical protein